MASARQQRQQRVWLIPALPNTCISSPGFHACQASACVLLHPALHQVTGPQLHISGRYGRQSRSQSMLGREAFGPHNHVISAVCLHCFAFESCP